MAQKNNSRGAARLRRKVRVRQRVQGSDNKPRLCVYRSNKYTYAQLISDEDGSTVLGTASSRSVKAPEGSTRSIESAKLVGQKIAELAKEKNIEHVVFDRNGYIFHGRVAAVAAGAREAGLKF